jgi:hypothetical protein
VVKATNPPRWLCHCAETGRGRSSLDETTARRASSHDAPHVLIYMQMGKLWKAC